MGVTRELGRANCLLAIKPGGFGVPGEQEPWRWWLAFDQQRVLLSWGEDTKHRKRARYRGRRAKSEQTRDGLLAVLADHSTEGQRGEIE
jgi:hypothetical protein